MTFVQCFGIHAGLFFICQYLMFRVKDYISSGLHMKVTDPDGGIHSIGKKNNSKVLAMNVMTKLLSGPKKAGP